jgi:hypothetical protein
MKKSLLVAIFSLFSAGCSFGQGFEIVALQEAYKGLIGETVKAPVRFKNNSDKPLTLIIRKVSSQIGSTQKSFFCLGNDCFDQKIEDYIVKVEPGQTLGTFQVAIEAGLVPGVSSVRYIAFSKSNPGYTLEFDINFAIDEKPERQTIYNSKNITLHDVYPNPVIDNAFVHYKVLDDQVKAKIIVHNILGNMVGEYNLPSSESLLRIKADDLSAGIYFYTLYLNNEGVMTRKLIIKK